MEAADARPAEEAAECPVRTRGVPAERCPAPLDDAAARAALGWLLDAAPLPGLVLAEWDGSPDGAADLAVGTAWDVVRTGLDLGLETLDLLRYARAAGPALCSVPQVRVDFLVPVGTADRWAVLPGTRALGRGRPLRVPLPRCVSGPRHWLVPPDGTGRLTDPAHLRRAVRQALRTLAVR